MEEEFNEIKTNILRTAGKLDSLKSKLPEEDSVNWDIIDHAGAVDFPAEEIQVDHTIDPVPVFSRTGCRNTGSSGDPGSTGRSGYGY